MGAPAAAVERSPVSPAGSAEIPAAETAAAEIPAAETPAAEIPAAETPAAETPATETPAAETLGTDADEPEVKGIERRLGADYRSGRRFADFAISPEVLAGLAALGYEHATPIQAASIEPGLAGRDLLLRAKTGTGKTAAFGVPVLDRIPAGTRKPRALILAPTRELALQVAQELTGIARFKDVGVCAIYGGVGFGPQEQALRDGVEVVVGTPGRLLDHVKRGNLKLETVDHVVLDEADEMLSMGFVEDVRKLLDRCAPVRQSMFCSATLNEQVRGLIDRYTKEPEEILLSADGDNVDLVQHLLFESSPDYHKARALLDVIEMVRPTSAIIFCNTKEDVSTVYNYLDRQGLSAEMLTGDLPQSRRERVMARIKAGAVQFLVSTDVAARGIDISDLSHVVNYALPDDAAVYTHRAGRTGRIGKNGVCISLAGGADFSSRLSLERIHKIKFEIRVLPTAEESAVLRTERLVRMLKEAMNTMVYESYLELVRKVKERPDAEHIFAAAMRAFVMWDRERRIQAADASVGEGGDDGGRPGEARELRPEDRRRDSDRRPERRDGDRREPRGGERRDGGFREAREPRRDGERRDGPDRARDGERRDGPDRPRDGERRDGPDRPRDGERRDGPDRARDGERRDGRGPRRDGDRNERREPRRDGDGARREDRPPRAERPADAAPTEGETSAADRPADGTGRPEGRSEPRRDRRGGRGGDRPEREASRGASEVADASGASEPGGARAGEPDGGVVSSDEDGASGGDPGRRPRRRRRRRGPGEGASGEEGRGSEGVESGGGDAGEAG